MSKAIVVTAGEAKFLVETDPAVELPPLVPVSSSSTAPSRPGIPPGMEPVVDLKDLPRRFSEVRDLIVVCCNSLGEVLAQIEQPEKFGVELGIKFAGEAGVPMLTKSTAEANLKISIEWKKE